MGFTPAITFSDRVFWVKPCAAMKAYEPCVVHIPRSHAGKLDTGSETIESWVLMFRSATYGVTRGVASRTVVGRTACDEDNDSPAAGCPLHGHVELKPGPPK